MGISCSSHSRCVAEHYSLCPRLQIGDAERYLCSSTNKDLFIRIGSAVRYGTLSGLVKYGHYNAEDRYPGLSIDTKDSTSTLLLSRE